MSGASKTFPPGEAPAAEAREEAALARELAPDSAPLDIALDEPPAEPSRVARGAEAIREFWRHAPLGPGVYRMIGSEGEVLYVGKARSIKKRIAAYMAPERQPSRIARMVAQTHSMVFVTTESDAEALLLEANLIKQLKPRYNVTLRDDKSFPYILICTGHPAARLVKHRGARNLVGDYFGPFAERRRGVSHPQRAAAGVSPAHLLGQFLRQSNPAVPALPDQALLGAVHRRDFARRIRQAGRRSARFPLRPQPRDQEPPRPRNERGRCGARFRKGGAAARPHQRALGDPGRAERQSSLDRRSRRVRDHRGGGAVLRRGVLLPHLPELGQSRLFSARRPGSGARGGARTRFWRNSISTGPRPGSCS